MANYLVKYKSICIKLCNGYSYRGVILQLSNDSHFLKFLLQFQMKDVIRIHQTMCRNHSTTLDMSLDGIQESKSSSLSADVFSVSFSKCRVVYPVRIIRPINKFKVDEQVQIKAVIDDINENGCIIETAIGDNPKRSNFRCALCFSATFACEYCESKAKYMKKEGNKKGHLTWPSSTSNGQERTVEKIIEITDNIRSSQAQLSKEECKGFWGTSHFLKQENFHFIDSIPAEYMHSGCLGVTKRMVLLTFNIGENKDRTLKRKLSEVSQYNGLISSIETVHEFSRRLRHLDFGVMKAQEFRNISLFFFPIVIKCIPNQYSREQKVWLQLTYIFRACTLPNKEFIEISKEIIEGTAKLCYKNYEAIYGPQNCSYSIHVIFSHILKIRGKYPMTQKSAFKYENFYGELRNLFQPGTVAPSKQILKNCYMKRQIDNHSCQKSIKYDVKTKSKENNSFIYQFHEGEYKFFRIIKKIDEDTFRCNPQGRYKYQNDVVKELNWSKVGVFKVGPFSDEEEIIIKRKHIEGKIIKVDNLFITCPNNVLREQ